MDRAALFKTLVWDALVKVALQKFYLLLPILGWGPIGLLTTLIVTHFSDQLFNALKDMVDLEIIALNNSDARIAFVAAYADLKKIGTDKGIDSKEFQDAREAHKAALARFIRFSVG